MHRYKIYSITNTWIYSRDLIPGMQDSDPQSVQKMVWFCLANLCVNSIETKVYSE